MTNKELTICAWTCQVLGWSFLLVSEAGNVENLFGLTVGLVLLLFGAGFFIWQIILTHRKGPPGPLRPA